MCPCSSFICASSIGMDEDRARSRKDKVLSNLDIEQMVKVKRELRDAEKVYVNGILQNGLESGNNNPFWTYNNNNNCLKSNIQCIEIRVQWTMHLGSSHMHGYM